MIPILVLKTENKVIYNKSNLNCKTFFEEFIFQTLWLPFKWLPWQQEKLFMLISMATVNLMLL